MSEHASHQYEAKGDVVGPDSASLGDSSQQEEYSPNVSANISVTISPSSRPHSTDDSNRFPSSPHISISLRRRHEVPSPPIDSPVSSPDPAEGTLWQCPPSTPPSLFPTQWPVQSLHPAFMGSRGRSVSASGPRGPVIVNSPLRGPIVPQKRYRPHTRSDSKRYVEEIELKPTIYFKDHKNGELIDGLPITLIMQNRIPGLQGRDDSMLSDCGPSIAVRVNWPGYASWSRQIPTRDFRRPPQPVTRAKLAKNVAKTVERFITEHQEGTMDGDSDADSAAANKKWKIGGPVGIHAADLVLLYLENVSKSSWQVALQLLHPRTQQSNAGTSTSLRKSEELDGDAWGLHRPG